MNTCTVKLFIISIEFFMDSFNLSRLECQSGAFEIAIALCSHIVFTLDPCKCEINPLKCYLQFSIEYINDNNNNSTTPQMYIDNFY